ncbi:hypothetical protein DY000_02012464 [Brassica cretica]|uniref:Uncharacterized protein n=1 Tax=Brassica cretica TaxID=69181 RepID=A0ABQ7CLL1_BRACR|nr:hypothetical protein DY000_02012464 [Brassica cretica]
MIQSPKPAKPVLHLPQLEASRFNQLQTRNLRPGDQSIHSGSLYRDPEFFYKFIPGTSNHCIRRIFIYSNLPYLEQTDINVQQLFSLQIRHDISTYQAPRKIPRKLSYPLKPYRFKKNQVSHLEPKSHKRLPSFRFWGTNESYMLTEVPRKEPDRKHSHEPPHKWKPKIELSVVQMPRLKVSFSDLKTPKTLDYPEVNPKPYSTSQGASQEIRALKMPYLTNQEGLNDEANFYGFYIQEVLQNNWNRDKVFTDQEVMNFTSQRFLSPSICEYPTLEEDSSPIKNRPEANPIIGVKRSLSSFRKAKDQ